MTYTFLLSIAIILLSTKIFGLASEKVHMPQVVGALVAGIVLGPSGLGFVEETDFLTKSAEIGVILLMFTAGLDTDMDELKHSGKSAFVIAIMGVLLSMAGGILCYRLFVGDMHDKQGILRAMFLGAIIVSTSVSISVEALREMGKLNSKIGTAILGSAVIDDVLGIIVLTLLSGFADPNANILMIFVRIIAFFAMLAIVGIILKRAYQLVGDKWTAHRRLAIYAFAFCLLLSFCADYFFDIADITGAYFAGLILSRIEPIQKYATKRMSIMGYMLFSPLFFASIGIKAEIGNMTSTLILFTVVFSIVAVASKIIGCGLGAKMMGYDTHSALSIGFGMIVRGEVSLIIAQKGEQIGLIDPSHFSPIVVMVIVTTLVTPVLLKLALRKDVHV